MRAHSGCLDEVRTRVPLLIHSLLGKAATPEETAGRLLRHLLRLLQMGDRLRMQPSPVQNLDAVLRLAHGSLEEFFRLLAFVESLLGAGLQELNTLQNVLKGINHPQKGGDGDDLSPV